VRFRSLLPLVLASLAIMAVLIPSIAAQSNPPQVVVMSPGTYYDPGACASVQVFGGYYFCSAPPTPVPATDTPTAAPATDTPTSVPTATSTATAPATATSTATSTPVPPTPTATATLIPATATVIVIANTPTPGSANAPTSVNGVPLCGVTQPNGQVIGPQHDPTAWHPLVEYKTPGVASSGVLCTYGHAHGANPHSVDSVFGQLPLAQEISYPWETVTTTGILENDATLHPNKHRVYEWVTAPSLACGTNPLDGSQHMVTAFREEFHADGSLGAAVRFHSYWGQYELTNCATGTKGYMSIGGHMDYGYLKGYQAVTIPLPVDPAPGTCQMNNDSRQEGELGKPAQSASVWYGSSSHHTVYGSTTKCDADTTGSHFDLQTNITRSNFGPVDRTNPPSVLLYGTNTNVGTHNGTGISTDALTIRVPQVTKLVNGAMTWSGFVDRHGSIVPTVVGKALGQDYIPVTLSNVEPGAYGSNGAAPCVGNLQHCPQTFKDDVPGPQGQPGYYVLPPS
jgi:hypothetical protein